jgi:alanine-glyoxylate transaminase/serine-glyoxylate transaminase/serine-pyruvate transaminase
MGYSARPANVLALLAGLGDALETAGADVDTSAGLDAARRALQGE